MKQSKSYYYRIVKKTYADGEVKYYLSWRSKGLAYIFGWYDSSAERTLEGTEEALNDYIKSDNKAYDNDKYYKKEIVG